MTNYIQQFDNPRFPFEKAEADRLAGKFDTAATVTDGIVRWTSNNAVPPADVLALWRHLGKAFDHDRSIAAGKAETDAFLTEYRRHHKGPSPEEITEMRAAFGPGTTVVDVITGTETLL